MKPRVHCSESGTALIELAVSIPIFIVLILGTAEIANLAWSSVQINNAARAGASFGSLSRANSADLTHIQAAAQNEAPKFITDPATQVTSTQVCYCVTAGVPGAADKGCTSTTLFTCAAPSIIQIAVQVNVQAPVTTVIHYPGLPASYTVRSQATMGVEQ